jgi:sigma-E factor negative regulatory protein RseB
VTSPAVLAVVAAAGLGAVAVCSLAALGSVPASTMGSDGWSGWTGKVDTAAVSDRAAMTPDDAVAVALLTRSAYATAKAASTVAYAGRAVTWDSSGTTTTDITHLPGRGTVSRTVGTLPADARFSPDGRSGSFADDGRPLALLRDNYRVLREAELDATVAGRVAEAVVAVDADGTLDARYWLDKGTGLLLRKELLDAHGRVRNRTGFESLRLGVPTDAVVPQATKDPWTEALGAAALVTARARGCACPESLPGGLALLEARRAPAGAVATMPVVHQLFSDGVATVSLFSIEGALSQADTDGLVARGFTRQQLGDHYAWVRGGTSSSATTTVVWACKTAVLTLVSDDSEEPLAMAGAVVAAFPPVPDPEDSSLWSRIARGWHRITGAGS